MRMKAMWVLAACAICLAAAVPALGQSDPLNAAYKPSVDCNAAHYPSNVALSGPLVKLRQDSGTPGTVPGAAPCVTVMATQNEFQSFQVHVQGPVGGYSALNVTMSALTKSTGPGGNFTIPAPSATATDIVVYKELYMDVIIRTGSAGTFYNATGFYPDALLPAIDPYYHQTTNAFPVSVAAGKNQSVWVDVLIPPSAPSGWYSGTVTVSNGGTTIAAMPVVYGVWQWPASAGGEMPSTTTLRSWVGISYEGGCDMMFGSQAACNYGGQTGDGAVTLVKEDAATMILDNRYSMGGGLINIFPCPTSGACGSFSEWDSNYASFFNGSTTHGATGITGLLAGAKVTSFSFIPDDQLGSVSQSANLVSGFKSHFDANGWTGLFIYLCDEPSPAGGGPPISTCVSNGNTYHSYTDPDVPNLVTANYPFVSANSGTTAIDWMVPTITDLEPPGGPLETLSDYTNWVAGEPTIRQWWSYLACGSAGTCGNGTVGGSQFSYPNYDVDGVPVANRAMEWLTFLHGQTAELYYNADICAQITVSTGQDCGRWSGHSSPLNEFTSNYYSGGWGDGTLIYYTGTAYNAGTSVPLIIPSMRLKMMRDGMQDYEYLHLLSGLGGAHAALVNAELGSWVTNSYTFNVNPIAAAGSFAGDLTDARLALGADMHQLTFPSGGGTLPVLPPHNLGVSVAKRVSVPVVANAR